MIVLFVPDRCDPPSAFTSFYSGSVLGGYIDISSRLFLNLKERYSASW